MRSKCRKRWDIESAYVSDTDLDDWINDAYLEMHDYIANINPEWILESTTVSVTSGTSTYQIGGASNDTYKIYGIDVDQGGRTYNMQKFMWAQRNRYSGSGSGTTPLNTRYRFMGLAGRIELRPVPGWSQDITVWYIPYPDELTMDTDNIDGYAAWGQYIINVIGIWYFDKRGTPNVAREEFARMNKRLYNSMREGDKAEPDVMRDVDLEQTGYEQPNLLNP